MEAETVALDRFGRVGPKTYEDVGACGGRRLKKSWCRVSFGKDCTVENTLLNA